jgi:hypothetical protein
MQVDPETMRGESGERVTTGSELETEFALSLGGTRWPSPAFPNRSEPRFSRSSHRGQIIGPGTPVTSSGIEGWDGDLSPVGTKLGFCAMCLGRKEIWQENLPNGMENVAASDDAYVRVDRHWSPDNSQLA